MFFPEALYLLSARDQQSTWLDPLIASAQTSLAAVTVTAVHTVPPERCLLLQAATLRGFPGAAQLNDLLEIFLSRPGAQATTIQAQNFAGGAANTPEWINWAGSVIVPPGWQITGSASFTAGAAANVARLDIVGLLIPVGNIQRL